MPHRKFIGTDVLARTMALAFVRFIRQFASCLMIILLAAIAISAAIGEFLDAVIISMLIILSAIVEFVQEYRSERIVEAIRQLTSPTIVVIRGGNEGNINSTEVVPGDLVIYSEGDRIPADSILIENHNMQTNESSLTGESLPSEKSVYPCSSADTPLHERRNLLYTGILSFLVEARDLFLQQRD